MALLEAVRKVSRFVGNVSTRAQYSGETLRMLRPFINEEEVEHGWSDAFEVHLLLGKRESFVDAASRLLGPHQRARLFFTLADTLGPDDFRPKDPRGNRNLILDIWERGKDKDVVMQAIINVEAAEATREKVLQSLRGR